MIFPLLFSLLFLSVQSLAPFNISNWNFLHSTVESPPPPSLFLKDVLKAISVRQRWNLDKIRVSDVDVGRVRVGNCQSYEFRLRLGKSILVFSFSDEISLWKKLRTSGQFGPDWIRSISSKPVITAFESEGLVELLVNGDNELSLALPLNTTHTGLRRLLVGEGITVEVEGAQGVTLVHPSNFGLPVNRSSVVNEARNHFYPFGYSLCMPLLTIQISGSASLVAYRTHNPNSYIKSTFLSQDTVELLPDKCYSNHFNKNPSCPIHSLSSRLALLEKLLRSFLGDRIFQNQTLGFLKSKITASTLVRFHLKLERDVSPNDKILDTLAAWRTKPTVERVLFEIVARVESERLKPLVVKKMKPFVSSDSVAWSNLMSNVSFTKFSSLVPQEALTLDVKW
ncbi:signal peptidase I [Tasmannia lanceolata]|uniref:signal peptidase I n=1 Tax=Tasmannia lanceolata TaxID=3420 RepID=UPI0040643299